MIDFTKIVLLFSLTVASGIYLTDIGIQDYGIWLGLIISFAYLIGCIPKK
jgi:predicted small integral membrane protein